MNTFIIQRFIIALGRLTVLKASLLLTDELSHMLRLDYVTLSFIRLHDGDDDE